MTFTRANSLGWALFELLTSDQMNHIDEQMPFAIDAGSGGLYSPTASIILDGTAGASEVLELRNVPNDGTLALNAINGSVGNLLNLEGTIHGTWIFGQGASLALGFEPLPVMRFNGHDNSTEQGGLAALFVGGAGIGATGTAGTGANARGGIGSSAPYRGGTGLVGESGATNFTGGGASSAGVIAGIGVLGGGSDTVGVDASHVGGVGVKGLGGLLSGTGRGGVGVWGLGGFGPTSTETGVDVGTGVRGDGSIGVHGVATIDLDFLLPSEFASQPIAGVKASAKNIGRSFLAEFSGNTGEGSTAAVRWVGSTGTGETAIFSVEAAQQFTTIADPDFTTLLLCTSNTVSGPIRGGRIEGRGRPGLSVSTAALSGVTYPGLEVVEQPKPTVHVPGGLLYMDVLGATGLLRDCHFMANNNGRYDRIIGSSDHAATWAWCRINCGGAGDPTLGANYGVATIDPAAAVVGTVDITLDTITDGPAADTSLVPTVSISYKPGGAGGLIANITPISATVLRVQINNHDGGVYDLTANAVTIFMHLHVQLGITANASQPTFFVP